MGKSKKKINAAENNFLSMPNVTKKKKIDRGKYLKKRIEDLFTEMENWLEGTDYKLKRKTIKVDEINLPVAEIYSGNKLIASLKTTGLWGFGVNCQINVETEKETNVIFDTANESSKPEWELIYKSGKSPKKLSKIIFRNLLRKVK
jgi:hypothetical protein